MSTLSAQKNNSQQYTIGIISLIALFLMACMKWLIEGILDKAIIEVILCFLIICFNFLFKGTKINKYGLIWSLFIFSILFSLATHDSTIGQLGHGIVTILITAFALFIDEPLENYKPVVKLMAVVGVIAAAFVLMHYLMQDLFSQHYIPLLNATAAETAKLYLRGGYFFGLMYNPHEPAGLIAFAIAAILIWKVAHKSRNPIWYIFCLLLLICLLFTGKKAVLMCATITLLFIILVLYGSRKQWLRGLLLTAIVVILSLSFVTISIQHPEVPFLNRFNNMFAQIIGGETADSGRLLLYQMAFSEWQDHMAFGIGWRHFNVMTVEKYHMTQPHEVNFDYLQWLCETGIVGFILCILPVLIMLYRTLIVARHVLKRIDDAELKWTVLMACYIQCFTCLYALVEIPFNDIVLFTMYIISTIVINSTYIRRNRHQ